MFKVINGVWINPRQVAALVPKADTAGGVRIYADGTGFDVPQGIEEVLEVLTDEPDLVYAENDVRGVLAKMRPTEELRAERDDKPSEAEARELFGNAGGWLVLDDASDERAAEQREASAARYNANARAALSGMLAHPTRYRPRPGAPANWHYAIAEEAYEIANAMARARALVEADMSGIERKVVAHYGGKQHGKGAAEGNRGGKAEPSDLVPPDLAVWRAIETVMRRASNAPNTEVIFTANGLLVQVSTFVRAPRDTEHRQMSVADRLSWEQLSSSVIDLPELVDRTITKANERLYRECRAYQTQATHEEGDGA